MDLIDLAKVKDGLSTGGIIVFVILSMIQVSKIPFNPWSAILKWIGNKLFADIKAQVTEIGEKLDKHIEESEKKELSDTRRDILDFCNACMNKRKHTQEQFKFVLKECDAYEEYVEKNHIKNGEIAAAIAEIKRIHAKCLQENSFLKEGEET